jgi:PAS domain S-box-containing protein
VSSLPYETSESDHRRQATVEIRRKAAELHEAAEALREVSRRSGRELDRRTAGFASVDRQWTITAINEGRERTFRRRPNQLIGRPLWEAFPAAVSARLRPELERVLAGNAPAWLEYRTPPARWVEVHVFPSAAGLDLYLHDVTGRRRAEEGLRTAGERLGLLSEVAAELLMTPDPIGVVDQVVARLAAQTHLELYLYYRARPDGALQLAAWKGVENAEHLARLQVGCEVCSSAAGGRRPLIFEHARNSTDPTAASLREFGVRALICHPLIARGRLVGTLSFGTRRRDTLEPGSVDLIRTVCNQTAVAIERREAEDALRESETKFRTLAESMHAAVGMVQGTRFVYANSYMAQMLGYSVEEILSLNFPALVHPAYRESMIDLARERQAGEPVPENYEFVALTKTGEQRWVDFSPARIVYQGRPAIVGVGFDITRHKELEALLRDSQARLAEARDAAEAANRAKDHFLAMLSHELRTPLAPVLATVSMLQQSTPPGSDVQESLELIRRNAELAARLIDDLLDVARIARGKIELNKRPVELAARIGHAVEVCKPDIDARGLHLQVEAGSVAYWVEADPARLQQVFWNLLKNAIKFTPQGSGCIGIHCREEGEGGVLVEVSDSGVGFEPEALGRIFKAFEQAEGTTNRRFGGLGLGLAISKALVEMHGGRIEAHSDGRDRGATFRVRLPLCARPGVTAASEPPVAQPEPQAAKRRLQILLVEDHRDTAEIMRRLLVLYGHDVRTAGDVATALSLASQHPFDLLISDLGLPDASGAELLQELRARGHTLPAVALSGYGQEEDVARSKAAGFVEHLLKPVDFNRFRRLVNDFAGAASRSGA